MSGTTPSPRPPARPPDPLPGQGLWGWLGRQIGYVRKAVHEDPTKSEQIVWRKEERHEAQSPELPGVTLRRTVVDEVVREKPPGQ